MCILYSPPAAYITTAANNRPAPYSPPRTRAKAMQASHGVGHMCRSAVQNGTYYDVKRAVLRSQTAQTLPHYGPSPGSRLPLHTAMHAAIRFQSILFYSKHLPRVSFFTIFAYDKATLGRLRASSLSARLHYPCIRQSYTRKTESKLSLRSFALSLHTIKLHSEM